MNIIVTRIATTAAAGAAAVAARKAVEYGWTMVRGEDPPTVGGIDADDDSQLRDLLLWSLVLAGAVLVARKIATSATEDLLGRD